MTPTATPTPAPTVTPAPTQTPTPTPTASPTPTPSNAQLMNISTRVPVRAGDEVGIGGFILQGSAPRKVIVRAIGPSMQVNNTPVAGRLEDPALQLYDRNGSLIATNDNWRSSQEAEIQESGLAPSHEKEAAIVMRLAANNYTAIIRGVGDTSGIGLVEVYDLESGESARLANISTRGFVDTGDDVMIGGFIAGGGGDRGDAKVVVRGIGPSLTSRGVPGALQDPVLELHDANGVTFARNDNWEDDPGAVEIASRQLAPTDARESATLQTLARGAYTAVLRGKDNAIGIALVEVYHLQ